MLSDCCNPCSSTPLPVNLPGSPGNDGTQGDPGTDGANAFSLTTADFDVPAIGADVAISVTDNRFMQLGQHVFVQGPANFSVVSKTGLTAISATFLGFNGDLAPASTISAGAGVSPGGYEPSLAGPLPTAFTDSSGGTASDTIAAAVGITTVTLPLSSLATGLSTGALDLLTTYTPGYAFELLSFDFVTTIVGAGAGATQAFNLEIGSTNVTGGVVTVDLASTNTVGEISSGTAITADNVGTSASTISVEMAAGGTVFTSGSGYFVLKLRNMDTVNAIASLAAHVDDLIVALT